jgi:hypothetical protein
MDYFVLAIGASYRPITIRVLAPSSRNCAPESRNLDSLVRRQIHDKCTIRAQIEPFATLAICRRVEA